MNEIKKYQIVIAMLVFLLLVLNVALPLARKYQASTKTSSIQQLLSSIQGKDQATKQLLAKQWVMTRSSNTSLGSSADAKRAAYGGSLCDLLWGLYISASDDFPEEILWAQIVAEGCENYYHR